MKIEMLVMADDFTGALDTGIQFAKSGAVTRVVTDPDCDFAKEQVQVLVIDKETRHRPPQEAARITQGIVERAVESGIRVFYTKTDSALRGNAGAEIEAMLRASGGTCVHFLPALPAMDRVVRGGVLYIGGQPAAESVFGKDPFEPITESAVPAILARQTGAPVCVRDCAQAEDGGEGIIVYNAETKEELDDAAAALARKIRGEDGPVLLPDDQRQCQRGDLPADQGGQGGRVRIPAAGQPGEADRPAFPPGGGGKGRRPACGGVGEQLLYHRHLRLAG